MNRIRSVACFRSCLVWLCCALSAVSSAAVELDPLLDPAQPQLSLSSEIGLDGAGKQITFNSLTGAAFWNHPQTDAMQPGLALVLERGAQNSGTFDNVNDQWLTRPKLTTVPGLYGMRWEAAAGKFRQKTLLWTPDPALAIQPAAGSNLQTELFTLGESGLLSIVLDPLFASNRYVYLVYSVVDAEIVPTTFLPPSTVTQGGVTYTISHKPKWFINQHDILVRITLNSACDGIVPGSPRRILDHRYGDVVYHHGGWMGFSPLYRDDAQKRHWLHITLGNQNAGQSTPNKDYNAPHCLSVMYADGTIEKRDNYLGKLLRIDVNPTLTDGPGKPAYEVPQANPWWTETVKGVTYTERNPIIAKGLRNPWRSGFDQQGALWIADVGDGKEEVTRLLPSYDFALRGGLNFGKDTPGRGEGYIAPTAANGVKDEENPLFWATSGGTGITAIIGGFVYRGSELPAAWQGRYLFAGHSEGLLALAKTEVPKGTSRALYLDKSINFSWFGDADKSVSSLAEDSAGEIHVTTVMGGLLRLSAKGGTVQPVAPDFTSQPPTTAATDVPFVYDLTVSGIPEPEVVVTSGPSWLSVSKVGSYAWRLQGTPPASAGSTTVSTVLTASGTAGSKAQTVMLAITSNQLPGYALSSTAVVAGGVSSTYFDALGTTDALAALDSFTGRAGVDTGLATAISIAPAGADASDYGLRFAGYVRAGTTGNYTFRLMADDRARLSIGSQQLQAINGIQQQTFALSAGWHALLLDHVQIGGAAQLDLQWQTPGSATFAAIPADSLARRAIIGGVDGYQPRTGFLGGMLPRTSATKNNAPATLTGTTAFADVASLRVGAGIVPYAVNNPLWSDGAAKQRWIAIPEGGSATFDAHAAWDFPIGTVFIKHFNLPRDHADPTGEQKRVETRFLVYGEGGQPYGITYRWRADQSEADLMTATAPDSPLVVTYSTGATRTWNIPSQQQCMTCHRGNAGDNGVRYFALGVLTHQLNGAYRYPSGRIVNQLQAWSDLGLLGSGFDRAQLPSYPASVSLDAPLDPIAGVTNELKVRSYLSSNCAMCHIGGTNVECPTLDARFSRASDAGDSGQRVQALINQPTQDGIDVMIRPKQPDLSMVLMRLNRSGAWTTAQMPPLGRTLVDAKAVGVFRSWISEQMPRAASGNISAVDVALPLAKSPLRSTDGFTYVSDLVPGWLTNPGQSTVRSIATVTGGAGDPGVGDPALYSSYRIGTMNWAFPVQPGLAYRVSVMMSDEYFSTRNSRLFTINLEGSTWVNQLDLVDKTAGKSRAYLLTRTIVATDGLLNLDFIRGAKDNPTVAAIRIEEVLPSAIGLNEPGRSDPWPDGQALVGRWIPLLSRSSRFHADQHASDIHRE